MSQAEARVTATGATVWENRPRERSLAEARPRRSWLLFPREHGAWGMVILPFLAGAVVAGEWQSWRAVAALLAVFSVFLLRDPLILLWRTFGSRPPLVPPQAGTEIRIAHSTVAQGREQSRTATRTLAVWTVTLIGSGAALLSSLPVWPLLALGSGGLALVCSSVIFGIRKSQRVLAVQLLSVAGLTASSLVAYLAVRGRLEPLAFAVWGMSAAHAYASVLVVRARLECKIASRNSDFAAPSQSFYRAAVRMQAVIWIVLAGVGLAGQPWLLLPFLPPSVLHWWELWQFQAGKNLRLSLHRVGFLQLGASALFYLLLGAVLRG